MDTSKKPYFPNLDASRFLAFLLVFMAHCFIPGIGNASESGTFQFLTSYGKLGFLGLEYFFVLSSFLITYLLILEIEKNGKFLVKDFLIRRALRVWPLYFVIVGLGFGIYIISHLLAPNQIMELPNPLYFLFFLVNFFAIENGMNFLFFLAFLWSISIEEQFYLFWAGIMKIYRQKLFPLLCLSLVVVSVLFRIYYADQERYLYFHTVSTLGNFGIGAYAAYLAYYKKAFFLKIIQLPKSMNIFFYLVLLISIFAFHELRQLDVFIWFQRTYYSILFAIFILIQAFAKNPVFKPEKIPQFNYLGKISYGLYCYHGVVITILVKSIEYLQIETSKWYSFYIFPMLIFAATVVIASLSYRYIEKPFLKYKLKFNHLSLHQ